MKRKLIAVLTGILMVCAIVGCGTGKTSEANNGKAETNATVESAESEDSATDGAVAGDDAQEADDASNEVQEEAGDTTATGESAENASTGDVTDNTGDADLSEVVEEEVVDRHWNNQADISWIDPEKPMVALSFDDGPVNPVNDSSTAIRIQNAIADNGMHATFFYWGHSYNGVTKAEIVRAYELGFELGNHTWTHPALTDLTAEEIEDEVSRIDKVLTEVSGQDKFLLRPPYLSINQTVKDTINVPLISCGLDTKDWDNASAQQIIDTIVAAAEDGSLDGQIVLMHETYATTAEAVEYLVPYLKEKGYQVVTISEMYKVRGVEMEAGNVYTKCEKQ